MLAVKYSVYGKKKKKVKTEKSSRRLKKMGDMSTQTGKDTNIISVSYTHLTLPTKRIV